MTAVSCAVRGLDAAQIDFFHREGYLVLETLFTPEDLQGAIDDIQRAIDEKTAALVRAGRLSRTYEEFDFEHRLAEISRETDEAAKSIWSGVLHGPGFFQLITNPKLLDVAESLCGEELIASSVYRLRPKIPNYDYGAVPWHQDSAYFEPYCDRGLVLTVWIPLVDANEENGCLWVIPRVHREVFQHRSSSAKAYLEILDECLPEGPRICCPVPKGGALLLTNLTPHGSFDNKTDIVRWSMDLRYQSAALPTNAKITRPPGEASPQGQTLDDPGFVPVACHPPEADFLVRSKTRPNEVLRTAEQFAALRATHVPTPVSERFGKWWRGGAGEANNPGRE
jgi:ectoine hydroxylase-related dioxygenase (phytanoyl-CoA dioxygenase family)